jgi:hypothetical protein
MYTEFWSKPLEKCHSVGKEQDEMWTELTENHDLVLVMLNLRVLQPESV